MGDDRKMKIVVGTYEKELYGFEWSPEQAAPDTLFAMSAHLGCVKAVATTGKYLVSGSTDENVRVFHLRNQTDIGTLYQHQGTVTCLAFHKNTHVLSGGEDGAINIWRVKDWEVLTSLETKSPVLGMAVHPSGRIAIGCYKDRHLRMWDLLKGRIAWKKTLKSVGDLVAFDPSESGEFVVSEGKSIATYDDG